MIEKATLLFVRQLADEFPDILAVLEEHETDNFGEILPHVFMGTLTFHLTSLIPQALQNARQLSELHRVLDRLERVYVTGPPEVRNLLAVSFLENLPYQDETGAGIREMIGPTLKAQLDLMD